MLKVKYLLLLQQYQSVTLETFMGASSSEQLSFPLIAVPFHSDLSALDPQDTETQMMLSLIVHSWHTFFYPFCGERRDEMKVYDVNPSDLTDSMFVLAAFPTLLLMISKNLT